MGAAIFFNYLKFPMPDADFLHSKGQTVDHKKGESYAWEEEYEKTWELLRDDADGLLSANADKLLEKVKKELESRISNVKLGMMRYLMIIVDASDSMTQSDYKPNRFAFVIDALKKFVKNFLDSNPIGQIGLIITTQKNVEKLSEFTGISSRITNAINSLSSTIPSGSISIQNALEYSAIFLSEHPRHVQKEILYIGGSINTCDPGSVAETLDKLIGHNIKCNFINMSSELFIMKKIAKDTRGTLYVPLGENHLNEIFNFIAEPVPIFKDSAFSLIKIGFPLKYVNKNQLNIKMCGLHFSPECIAKSYYECPNCSAAYCSIPIDCKICNTILTSSIFVSRAYRYLFPIKEFQTYSIIDDMNEIECSACMQAIAAKDQVYFKNENGDIYCLACNIFMHKTIHSSFV